MQTYKFYNKTGKRLGIFGTINEGKINIIILLFSKSKKETVKEYRGILKYYQNWKVRPVPHKKFVISGDSSEDFLRWCRSNYKQLYIATFKNCLIKSIKQYKDFAQVNYIR